MTQNACRSTTSTTTTVQCLPVAQRKIQAKAKPKKPMEPKPKEKPELKTMHGAKGT
jgi:hypothetical protein